MIDKENIITKTIENIEYRATEDFENFIFEIIQPYCNVITTTKISKEDLKCILLQYFNKESDTISRKIAKYKYKQKLINNLKDKVRNIDLSDYIEEPYKMFCEFIDSLPSATNSIGHWVKGDKTEYKCD